MKYSIALVALAFCALFLVPRQLHSQQTTKIHRVGLLSGASYAATQARIDAFRNELRDLGYIEGKNVVIELRYADGHADRLPSLAADLVQSKTEVIVVAGGEPVAAAAANATKTIPIIMANAFDPVASGLVASLARPGGNITGLTTTPGPEIHGKQTELLKEAVPKLNRFGVLANPANSFTALAMKEISTAAQNFGLSFEVVEVRNAADFEREFATLNKQRVQGLLQLPDPLFLNARTRLIALENESRLPTLHSSIEYADAGALLAYGAERTDLFRRAAIYVDKILKGAKPADLPIEQPTKFEFIINLKTAKQLGMTIPPNVLARADRVIR